MFANQNGRVDNGKCLYRPAEQVEMSKCFTTGPCCDTPCPINSVSNPAIEFCANCGRIL